jgi:hypothetical protein
MFIEIMTNVYEKAKFELKFINKEDSKYAEKVN